MPGVLAWGYYPTDKIWLPVQVDANGRIKADMSAINLDDLADVSVPTPTDDYFIYWDAATSLWKCRALVDADIPATICRDSELAGHAALPDIHHATHLKTLADHPLSIIPTMDDDHIPTSIARDIELATAVSDHAALATGVHGVGANYIPAAPAASHLVRTFTKGWASGKLVKGAGVNANPIESFLTHLFGLLCGGTFHIKTWEDIVGFATSFGVTGYFGPGWTMGFLGTGATSGSKAALYSTTIIYVAYFAYGHFLYGYVSVRQTTAQTFKFGAFTNPAAPTETEKHFCFKIVNADIYASCGDGTAQTIEDTGVDASSDTYLAIDDNATSLDFYVNGVLRKSFTTNRPSACTLYPGYYAINSAAADKQFFLRPLILFTGYKEGY